MSEAEIRSGVEQPDLTPLFRLGYKVTVTVFSPSENPTDTHCFPSVMSVSVPAARAAVERQPLKTAGGKGGV